MKVKGKSRTQDTPHLIMQEYTASNLKLVRYCPRFQTRSMVAGGTAYRKSPMKMTRRRMRKTHKIFHLKFAQMMYLNVFHGFMNHRKDVSGRLQTSKRNVKQVLAGGYGGERQKILT